MGQRRIRILEHEWPTTNTHYTAQVKKPDVATYLAATARIEGWFYPIDAYAFAMFDDIQKSERIKGNLFEIGVHHGKSAILLGRAAAGEEIVGVCDIFEEDTRDHFIEYMRAHSPLPPERLTIFAKRSTTLTADDTTTKCRLFHVDASHSAKDVFADLVTADRAINHDGVLAVDDVFSSVWPGVSEGFYNFISSRPDAFVPVFIGANKVYLTRPDSAVLYENHWADAGALGRFFEPGPYTFEVKEWLGRPVVTAVGVVVPDDGPPTWRKRLKTMIGG